MSAVNLPNRAALNAQSRPWAAAQLKLLVMFRALASDAQLLPAGAKGCITASLLFFFFPLRRSDQLIDETPVKRPQQQPAQALRSRPPLVSLL